MVCGKSACTAAATRAPPLTVSAPAAPAASAMRAPAQAPRSGIGMGAVRGHYQRLRRWFRGGAQGRRARAGASGACETAARATTGGARQRRRRDAASAARPRFDEWNRGMQGRKTHRRGREVPV
jgi:hypothetical protein